MGGSHADRDEREHIQAAVDDRHPASLEKRPSAPENHRSRQNKLEPIKKLRRNNLLHGLPGNHVGHGEKCDRHTQHDANPKPPRHVDQLGMGFFLQSYSARLQGHAAYGTETRRRAHNLRMHRTHVLGFDRRRTKRGRLERHTTFGTWPWLRLTHFGVHGTNVSYVLRPIGLDGLGSDVFGAMLVPVRWMDVARRRPELIRVSLVLRESLVAARQVVLH